MARKKKTERCNCDASCGENRYHDKGSSGCKYEVIPPLSDHEVFAARAKELFAPIDQQIMMCDNAEDSMALATVMMNSAARIFINCVGNEGAIIIIEDILVSIKANLKK